VAAGLQLARSMTDDALLQRSRAFALDVIRFCLRLDPDPLGRVAQPPLLRAGTGTALHYRAACRARSSRTRAARLTRVLASLDDAEFWLEALLNLKFGPGTAAHQLHIEAQELRAHVGDQLAAVHPAPSSRLTAHLATRPA
jgi:four helix bundle protein